MRAGNTIIIVGGMILAIGLIVRFAPWAVSWFGNLPGDVRLENERSSVFIPITSMIIVSVVGSLLLNLALRWFRSG